MLFCDLRGFTAFAETAEPEEVMGVLREYHAEMGRLILAAEGTLERFTGDGMMIFFNDPVQVPDPGPRAVRMAVAMRERIAGLTESWRKRGFDLDFGIGIAQGYATIGAIGFEGRLDYGAIGTVTNLASRLCGEAKPGQILLSQRVAADRQPTVRDVQDQLALVVFHQQMTGLGGAVQVKHGHLENPLQQATMGHTEKLIAAEDELQRRELNALAGTEPPKEHPVNRIHIEEDGLPVRGLLRHAP